MFICKGPPALNSRFSHLVLTLVILALFFHTIQISNGRQSGSPLLRDAEVIPEGNASPEELYLSRLARECGLSEQMSWLAWRIVPSEQTEEWPSVTEVNLNFESVTPKMINLSQPDRMDLHAKKRMELPVPVSPLLGQVDASDFLFGVSTTYARIADRDYAMVKAWARWLTDGQQHSNGASLVVVLDQAGNGQLEEVDQMLQSSGIDCWVTTTEEPMSMARRYFELSRILKTFAANLAANGQDKRWFGLVEDDVFFPSLSYLRDRLFTYNTDGQHYIGLPSERLDWDTDAYEDVMRTYGGGAILLTRTAVSRVPNLPCFDPNPTTQSEGGVSSFRSKRWDELLHDCMMKYSDLEMHVLPGFFSPNDELYDPQIDSYETGQQPLLLRRYAERHLLNINKAHLVTNVCGESCFMQRYLFHDNWVLVNGISITEYPDGIEIQRKEKAPEPDQHPEPQTENKEQEPEVTPEEPKESLQKRAEPPAEPAPKPEAPKQEAPKPEALKLEAPKPKAPEPEAPEAGPDEVTPEEDETEKLEVENAGAVLPAPAEGEGETEGNGDAMEADTLSSSALHRVVIDDDSGMVDKAVLKWSGRKNMFRLADSAISKDGAVWQAYVKKAKKDSDDEIDSVIVLIWEHGKSTA